MIGCNIVREGYGKDGKTAKKVLFVCTGNSCRSIMAEAYLKKRVKEENLAIEVRSAGTICPDGMKPTRETLKVLKEEKIDSVESVSARLTKDIISWADLILVMEHMHREKIVSLSPAAMDKVFFLGEYNDEANDIFIPDPIGRPLAFYRVTFQLIKESIEEFIKCEKESR